MKRIAIVLLLGTAPMAAVFAQQARLDSLTSLLKRQTEPSAARAHTLAAMAKACSTIDPERAFTISRQAVALAQELKDDRSLVEAWVSQRWVYYYLGKYSTCDSVNRLATAAAKRSGDPRSWVLVYGTPHYISSMPDSIAHPRFDRALHIADSMDDHALTAEVLYWFGHKAYFTQEPASIERSMVLWRSLGDLSGEAMCLMVLDQFEPYASDSALKLHNMERSAELFDRDGNIIWSLWAHSSLSMLASARADYKTAVEEGLKALDKAERAGLGPEFYYAEDALAQAYRAMGDQRSALRHQLRALEFGNEINFRLSNMNLIGRSYRLLGLHDSAEHYLIASMKLLEQHRRKHPTYDAWRLHEAEGFLAELRAEQGRFEESAGLYRSAITAHEENAYANPEETWALIGYGRLLANATDAQLGSVGSTQAKARREALQLLQRALALARQLGMLKEQEDAYFELARLYEREGDLARAFEYQKLHAAMKDSVLSTEKVKAVARLESAREEERRMVATRAEQARKDAEAAGELEGQKLLRNWSIGGAVLLALAAGVFLYQRNRTRKEKARSEEILYNVLPEEVAKEIRKTGGAQSREIDHVSILFTDFKGFTELSARISRQELMDELNACFKAFDVIIGQHGVEKIKTIGDSYMAAAGLKGGAIHAAVGAVKAALEMQAFMKARKIERDMEGKPAFEMRVGIHTGPVVAGIVGVKKFQYDIWGDTVNTASRMESSGEVGHVNISEATYALVKNEVGLTFMPRGKVQAKGKGEMEMYFVSSTA